MKNRINIGFAIILLIACKQKTETKSPEVKLSIAEKIANAHGFENWKYVDEINFTFAGKRRWIWQPKTNAVTFIQDTIKVQYNRACIDSTVAKIDPAFINDKFWLLIPFQLVWDTSATISEATKSKAPISKIEMNKLTLLYPSEGGYTLGDAYDIYFKDDYIIKEWVFRKGNADTASLTNTCLLYTSDAADD